MTDYNNAQVNKLTDTKVTLIFLIFITISFSALVVYLTEHSNYFKIYVSASPMPKPGTVVPNKYLLTLKNDASLECFGSHLKKQGINVTLISANQLTIEMPANMTIGEIKQIFNPTGTANESLTEQDMKPIANVTQGCDLIKGNADLVTGCEPEVEGGPVGPGI